MVEGWVNGGWKGGLLLISQVPHKSCTAENKLSSVDNDPATNQNDTATNMNDTATNKNDTATHMIDTPSRKNGPTIRPILFLTKRNQIYSCLQLLKTDNHIAETFSSFPLLLPF